MSIRLWFAFMYGVYFLTLSGTAHGGYYAELGLLPGQVAGLVQSDNDDLRFRAESVKDKAAGGQTITVESCNAEAKNNLLVPVRDGANRSNPPCDNADQTRQDAVRLQRITGRVNEILSDLSYQRQTLERASELLDATLEHLQGTPEGQDEEYAAGLNLLIAVYGQLNRAVRFYGESVVNAEQAAGILVNTEEFQDLSNQLRSKTRNDEDGALPRLYYLIDNDLRDGAPTREAIQERLTSAPEGFTQSDRFTEINTQLDQWIASFEQNYRPAPAP